MEIIGHRGAAASFVENSLEGFRWAMSLPVTAVECDIQWTKDLVPILYHDSFLSPQLSGYRDQPVVRSAWPIYQKSWEEIRQTKLLPSMKENQLTSCSSPQAIPSLNDLLNLKSAERSPCHLVLELKYRPDAIGHLSPPREVLVERLLQKLEESALSDWRTSVIIKSFDWPLIAEVRRQDSRVQLGLVYGDTPKLIPYQFLPWMPTRWPVFREWIEKHEISVLSAQAQWLYYKKRLPKLLTLFPQLKIWAWTVNEVKWWKGLQDSGIHGIITDKPSELKGFLNANNKSARVD